MTTEEPTPRRLYRDKNFIGAGLKNHGPNLNVLNVLRVLIEDDSNVAYISEHGYRRTSEEVRDPRVIETPGRKIKVIGYRSHETRLNFSVLCLKDVKVKPKYSRAKPLDKKVFRTYNVILDGKLHLREISVQLTEESFLALHDAGLIDEREGYAPEKLYRLDLSELPLVSGVWANPSVLGLTDLLREEKELKTEHKAISARRAETSPAATRGTGQGSEIYIEDSRKIDGTVVEKYTAKCVEIRLLGYKPTKYDCSTMTYDQATARGKAISRRLTIVRFLIRAIVFAMEAVNSKSISWGAVKITKRGKWPKVEQLAVYQNTKLKRITWTEEFSRS